MSPFPFGKSQIAMSDISDDMTSLSLASSPSPFKCPRLSSSPFAAVDTTLFSSVWRDDAPKCVIASSLGLQKCPDANERKMCSSTCPYFHPGTIDGTQSNRQNLVDGKNLFVVISESRFHEM